MRKPDGPTMNVFSNTCDSRPIRVIRSSHSLTEVLSNGLTSLVTHKNLLFEMTLLRVRVRYRQSLLGWVWAVLPSLLLMVTYTLVFSRFIGLDSAQLPYALFIFSGLVPWMFFSTSVSSATAGIVRHRYLISRIAFPREIIPLSYVAASFVDLVVGALMVAAMMWYFGFSLTIHILYAIPLTGLLFACSLAAALCCSSFQARFRDIGIALPLALQMLMFLTPVVYSSAAIPGSYKALYFANPMAILIDAFRQVAVLGGGPSALQMIYCTIVSSIFLVVSYVLFKRLDATLADVI
jgi:lipopolysaccharide transport system permease protein